MVTISGLLRFIQEYRSGRAAEKLKSMVRSTATVVRRDSHSSEPVRRELPMNELVPGDIVELQAGDMIPADIRLLQSRDLFISQAILTGEALPVEKYDTLGSVSAKRAEAQAGEKMCIRDRARGRRAASSMSFPSGPCSSRTAKWGCRPAATTGCRAPWTSATSSTRRAHWRTAW